MGGTLYYIHSDHLGSTVAASDDSGQAVGRAQYDPYGEVITSTLPAALTDRLFTGQRWHGTIGLYQMGARWYDPALGRWLQADTIVPEPGEPQALNRYTYVYNNPLRYTDPSGHWIFEETPGDPWIWYSDKPVNTLIRTAEPVVFWEETREPTVGDIVLVLGAPYIAAGVTVAGEVVVADIALPAVQTAWGQVALRLGPLAQQAWERGKEAIRQPFVDYITRRLTQLAERAAQNPSLRPRAQRAIQRGVKPARALWSRGVHVRLEDLVKGDWILWRVLERTPHIPPGQLGPDFYARWLGVWWDLTTEGQWAAHITKYAAQFGEGIRIPYP